MQIIRKERQRMIIIMRNTAGNYDEEDRNISYEVKLHFNIFHYNNGLQVLHN